MLMRVWVAEWPGSYDGIDLVIMLLMRLLTLDVGELALLFIDARRNLSGVCSRWYPVVLDLHRFFIAISRAVVNHDGFAGYCS